MERFLVHAEAATPRAILVDCPSCQQPGFVDSWPTIVSTLDENARTLLQQGKLFKYTCPVCAASVSMTYECLYQDVEHRVLIHYSPIREARDQQKQVLCELASRAATQEGSGVLAYQLRIVNTTFEFCEKVRILDDGYDDRVIELMKVAIKRGMLADGIIGARDTLIYERTLDNGGVSFIVTGEIPGDTVGVPQGYTYLRDMWTNELDELTDEYCFDAAWANAFLP